MTGAPLAMVGCGLSADDATLGISWHVMAMFAPSFFTGSLIHRFGAERIVAVGLVLLIGCAVVALSGIALWQFWTALILLGLGWNFGFIGATAMVAASYRPSEKGKVQGFHDFVLFGSVAFASLMSGAVYNAWGWEMLNWIVFPVAAALPACCLAGHAARRRRCLTRARPVPRNCATLTVRLNRYKQVPVLRGAAARLSRRKPGENQQYLDVRERLFRIHADRRAGEFLTAARSPVSSVRGGVLPGQNRGKFGNDHALRRHRLRLAFDRLRHLGDTIGAGCRSGQCAHAGDRRAPSAKARRPISAASTRPSPSSASSSSSSPGSALGGIVGHRLPDRRGAVGRSPASSA